MVVFFCSEDAEREENLASAPADARVPDSIPSVPDSADHDAEGAAKDWWNDSLDLRAIETFENGEFH